MTTPVPLEEEEGGQIEELLQVEIHFIHFLFAQVPSLPCPSDHSQVIIS